MSFKSVVRKGSDLTCKLHETDISITMLQWNRSFWMDVASHKTSFSQSEFTTYLWHQQTTYDFKTNKAINNVCVTK